MPFRRTLCWGGSRRVNSVQCAGRVDGDDAICLHVDPGCRIGSEPGVHDRQIVAAGIDRVQPIDAGLIAVRGKAHARLRAGQGHMRAGYGGAHRVQ